MEQQPTTIVDARGAVRPNKAGRLLRNAEIIKLHRAGQDQIQIAKQFGCGQSTVHDVLKKAGELGRAGRQKLTRMELYAQHRGFRPKALTREEVDPEFKGTAIDFVDKYGHVQLQNAEERARMRFADWAIELGAIARQIKGKLPEVDIDWLRSPKPSDIEKLSAAVAVLKPIIETAEILLLYEKHHETNRREPT